MRIVAGTAGGIPLVPPPGDLRPTMDKVRGAIFSSLAGWVEGRRVLDLFAGSGSLGLEALSRGAASVVLVEKNPAAVRTIGENLRKTRLPVTAVTLQQEDVFSFLRRPPMAAFDLILADPPYSKKPDAPDFARALLQEETLPKFLAPEGLLVLEVFRQWAAPAATAWHLQRTRTYGESKVCYYIHCKP